MTRIVTAAEIGLNFDNVFGALGPERTVTGHWSAGPEDVSDAHCAQLIRSYHAFHKSKGWGGLGYHFVISRRGTIFCCRPTSLKGAHVGGWNSENLGVMMHGLPGGKPTIAQKRAFRQLLRLAHTTRFVARHRTDCDLRVAARRGHNDWPGHESNQCPGSYKTLYISGGRKR